MLLTRRVAVGASERVPATADAADDRPRARSVALWRSDKLGEACLALSLPLLLRLQLRRASGCREARAIAAARTKQKEEAPAAPPTPKRKNDALLLISAAALYLVTTSDCVVACC